MSPSSALSYSLPPLPCTMVAQDGEELWGPPLYLLSYSSTSLQPLVESTWKIHRSTTGTLIPFADVSLLFQVRRDIA